MPNFTVEQHGVDTSGRPILTTAYMWQAHLDVLADPEVAPFAHKVIIVQGAFMSRIGGGAKASQGYHDLAGCIDYRTLNLTTDELGKFIRAWRRRGGAAWRRDAAHGGFDPHCHVTLGSDHPLASGAQDSWRQYLAGDNGLTGSSHGPDYEWRPSPLVTSFTPSEEDDMPTVQDLLSAHVGKRADQDVEGALATAYRVEDKVDRILNQLDAAQQRDAAIRDGLGAIQTALSDIESNQSDDPTDTQLEKVRGQVKDVRKKVRDLTELLRPHEDSNANPTATQ